MSGIRSLLIDLFEENKIKSYINPDEVLAIGASLEAVKILKKMKFILQDIIAFDIQVLIQNPKMFIEKLYILLFQNIQKFPLIMMIVTFYY